MARVFVETNEDIDVSLGEALSFGARLDANGTNGAVLRLNGARGTLQWGGDGPEWIEARLAVHPLAVKQSLVEILRQAAATLLPARGALLVHGAAVDFEDMAVLLLGASTAGKTTTARRAGREGATRLADDTVVLRFGPEIAIHPFPSDPGARLKGRLDKRWSVRRAYSVLKGAPITRVIGPHPRPLEAWCRSLFSTWLTPQQRVATLDGISELTRRLPVRQFEVSASGPVLQAIRDDLLEEK